MSVKTEFLKDINKYWTITTTEKTGHYGQTMILGVVAKTAEDAKRSVDEIRKFVLERLPGETDE